MKSFIQFFTEAEHDHAPYTDWGVVHSRGLTSGQNHPTASNHPDLTYRLKHKEQHAGYGLSHQELSIGGQHHQIKHVLKHWDKIPKHHEGNTRAEFSGPGKQYFHTQGHHKKVYNDLKNYHATLPKEDQ